MTDRDERAIVDRGVGEADHLQRLWTPHRMNYIVEAPLSRDEARRAIYGMDYAEWKKDQPEATPEQLARMEASVARNPG